MTDKKTVQKILALPMEENDSGATTFGGYLKALLVALFREGEGFGGKRPFGNSGWEYDLYKPLVKAKYIKGKFDKDGYLDVDYEKADKFILEVVEGIEL